MAAFAWQDDYSVGDATIDGQHRRIIDILNDLHAELNRGQHDAAAAGAIFDQLASYVMTHFAYEEQRMIEGGYPAEKVAEHRKTHNRLLRKVQEIMQAHESGDREALAELLPYLYGDWLISHICGDDQDYAGYLRPS